MIYFEKNGFQYSTRVFVWKKAFRNKKNGTIGKSRKKSIDISPWFFFKDAAYDYERVKQSAFYAKKAPRALGGPFLLDALIYQSNESTTTNQNSIIAMTDFIHHILKEDNIIREL